jgi:wobble nucleotide-excising tRNase
MMTSWKQRGAVMLKKLVRVNNVGLLRDGVPTPADFGAVTLVYAENGRGKTTVANILRAVTRGDAQAIADGSTIDSDQPPYVNVLCADASGNAAVVLENGAWTGTPPEILIFDPTFVEDNVYSGQEVRADHRQQLLQFALGTHAVKLERKVADLTKVIADEQRKVSEAQKRIQAHSKTLTVDQFVMLADDPAAEEKIAALRSRIEAARNASTFLQRPSPEQLPQIEFNTDAFFNIIQATFHGVREDAKAVVQAHFDQHKEPPGIEEWVTTGLKFSAEHGCPFCGQDLKASTLIEAYDAYFNKALNDFMERVAVLGRGVDDRFAETRLERIAGIAEANDARVTAWKDQLDVSSPGLDAERAKATLAALRALASNLAKNKQRRPLDIVGTPDEKAEIARLLADVRAQITTYNDAVIVIGKRIADFNKELAGDTPATITAAIARLEAVIARRTDQAKEAIAEYDAAKAKKDQLTNEKASAREELDALLPELLKKYEATINGFLRHFGAAFTIDKFTSNNHGGLVRSNYGLRLRGREVALGARTDRRPSFRSVLSEGDKRTLALSFFFARLHAKPDELAGKIVVLDDPVCSMDSIRRNRTIRSIVELADKGVQVVVLSHDAYFLRSLRSLLGDSRRNVSTKVYEIRRAENDYSRVDSCDLDYICQSRYEQDYGNVASFAAGTFQGKLGDVASALRPLVEGAFKQRFPSPLLSKNLPLAGIIGAIRGALDDSPLALAKPYVEKMSALNDFATGSHHNDLEPSRPIDDGELKQYAMMALELVHGDPVVH